MRTRSLLSAATLLILFSRSLFAEEGMWLLDAVYKLPLEQMRPHGLMLSPSRIYSPDSTSLKDAIVHLGGGTGSFISASGLIITNHHVAYGSIQALSSVQNDYLRNGFLARTRQEELSTATTAEIVMAMKEVTTEVLGALSDTLSPEQRSLAVQERIRAIEAAAQGDTGATHRVVEMNNGVQYYLFTTLTLRDVRLVYAPPTSIGNFGGEVDNWMWPRHTGDFTILRAYVGPDGKPAKYAADNLPFRPRQFLPISSRGVKEGDFAMVMGFPARTFRYREAAGVELARDITLPVQIDLYKTRIDIIESMAADNRAIGIKYASKVRGIANASKKYVGVLEGMRRTDLVARKRAEEEQFGRVGTGSPADRAQWSALLAEIESATDEARRVERKNQILSNLTSAVELIGIANRFLSYASLPAGFDTRPEKEITSLREYLDRIFKNHDTQVDRAMMVAMILKSDAMPADQRIEAFQSITEGKTGEELERRVREYVEGLYGDSRLATRDGCEELMQKDQEEMLADPVVRLAAQVSKEQEPVTVATNAYATRIGQLRRRYARALADRDQAPLAYPDANRTIRLTYGTVQDLHPRDAVVLAPQTLLGGVIEKEQKTEPFIVPAALKELWQKKDFGPYADPKLGDVPVAFIADLDITGGNSGSPVINGRGELIGCAFDGNWESVVGDYLYQERYNRSINVDVRYVLFILDKFAGARNILEELVIH